MASIRRHRRTKYWVACFTNADGNRSQRSTRILARGRVEDRRAAQKIADSFEDAANRRFTSRQIQRVLADVYKASTGQGLRETTVDAFARAWIAGRKAEIAERTLSFYAQCAEAFLESLPERGAIPMAQVEPAHVRRFRDAEARRVSTTTVNHALKVVRMLFNAARREGFIADNPAELVPVLKNPDRSRRRAFKLDELHRLLQVADPEWRSLVLFGLYTGQRLGDLARLTWRSVDTERKEIRFVAGKTGRQMIIPIAPALLREIAALEGADNPDAPLHPRAAAVLSGQGKVGTLSRQFYDLMAEAGLVPVRAHRKKAAGGPGSSKRQSSDISFHALRHTATSLLKNAGISPAIVQEFIGHESKEINRVYTHIDEQSLRQAAEAIPDITNPGCAQPE